MGVVLAPSEQAPEQDRELAGGGHDLLSELEGWCQGLLMCLLVVVGVSG